MEKKYGTVDRVRTLQVNAGPLVRSNLSGVSCLAASYNLNFLAEAGERMELVIVGYYSNRKRFVVRSYHVLGSPKLWQNTRGVCTQEKRSDKMKE